MTRISHNRRSPNNPRGPGRRGGGYRGAAPFTPASLGDLILDIDADDYAAGAITSLLDKSSGALAFTGTATVNATGINGTKSIDFNGTSNQMTSSAAWALLNGKTALTWIAVMSDTDVDAASVFLETSASATANAGTVLLYTRLLSVAQFNQLGRGTAISEYYATDSLATAAVWSGQIDFNLTTAEAALMRKDGATVSTTLVANNNNSGQTFGSHTLYLGARAGSSLFWVGKLRRLLCYGRALTVSEINQAERYLGALSGISVPLA